MLQRTIKLLTSSGMIWVKYNNFIIETFKGNGLEHGHFMIQVGHLPFLALLPFLILLSFCSSLSFFPSLSFCPSVLPCPSAPLPSRVLLPFHAPLPFCSSLSFFPSLSFRPSALPYPSSLSCPSPLLFFLIILPFSVLLFFLALLPFLVLLPFLAVSDIPSFLMMSSTKLVTCSIPAKNSESADEISNSLMWYFTRSLPSPFQIKGSFSTGPEAKRQLRNSIYRSPGAASALVNTTELISESGTVMTGLVTATRPRPAPPPPPEPDRRRFLEAPRTKKDAIKDHHEYGNITCRHSSKLDS